MRIHFENKTYQYSHFDRTFSNNNHLRKHMSAQLHTQERNHFIVSYVVKLLQTIVFLHTIWRNILGRNHISANIVTCLSHEKLNSIPQYDTYWWKKTYECNQCGKTFVTTNYLTYHMKTPTGEKPYGSNQCGRTFILSIHPTPHMKIHTGEKSYQCI